MDDHEICRKHIEKLEDENADQEITIGVKDELIAHLSAENKALTDENKALAAENRIFRLDREVLIPEGATG